MGHLYVDLTRAGFDPQHLFVHGYPGAYQTITTGSGATVRLRGGRVMEAERTRVTLHNNAVSAAFPLSTLPPLPPLQPVLLDLPAVASDSEDDQEE